MSKNSPSARKHRALKFLSQLVQYKTYGPLIGPKTLEQELATWGSKGDRRWEKK